MRILLHVAVSLGVKGWKDGMESGVWRVREVVSLVYIYRACEKENDGFRRDAAGCPWKPIPSTASCVGLGIMNTSSAVCMRRERNMEQQRTKMQQRDPPDPRCRFSPTNVLCHGGLVSQFV